MLERHAPVLAFPDGVLNERKRISGERESAGNAKHLQIFGAWSARAAGQVGREEADDDAVDEPLPEKFAHGRGATGPDSEHADWPTPELLNHLGRLHVLVIAKRHDVAPA